MKFDRLANIVRFFVSRRAKTEILCISPRQGDTTTRARSTRDALSNAHASRSRPSRDSRATSRLAHSARPAREVETRGIRAEAEGAVDRVKRAPGFDRAAMATVTVAPTRVASESASQCTTSAPTATDCDLTKEIILAAYRQDAKKVKEVLTRCEAGATAGMSLSRSAAVELLGEEVYLGSHSWSTQEGFPVMYFAGASRLGTRRARRPRPPRRARGVRFPRFLFPAKQHVRFRIPRAGRTRGARRDAARVARASRSSAEIAREASSRESRVVPARTRARGRANRDAARSVRACAKRRRETGSFFGSFRLAGTWILFQALPSTEDLTNPPPPLPPSLPPESSRS